jgi:hypothetical protein
MTFVPFFNFHALKFNANTVLLPLWAATTLCFLRSYERRTMLWAALAGVFAAASMLGKYWSVFLLLGLGIAALLDSRRAAYFKSAAPWVTIAVGVVLIAPHLVWLVSAEFTPLYYATAVRSGAGGHPLKSAGGYLAGALAYAALPAVLALAAIKPSRTVAADMLWPATPERRLAIAAFWLPLLLPAALAPIVGFEVTSLWNVGMGAASGGAAVVAVGCFGPKTGGGNGGDSRRVSHLDGRGRAVHRRGHSPWRRFACGDALASFGATRGARMAPRHRQATADGGGGKRSRAYGVAAYLPGRPSAFPEFNRKLAPWADAARLKRDGVAIVCQAADPTCGMPAAALGLSGPRTEVEVTRTYFGTAGRTGRYTIVIVPPQP